MNRPNDRISGLKNGLSIAVNDLIHAQKLDIKFGLHIGLGTYSSVYKVKYKTDIVALKVCEKTGVVKKLTDRELNVLEILKDKPHENIIQFYDKFESFDEQRIWILMEWFNGMDLVDKLMKNGRPFEESVCKQYFRQMVEGVKFLHSLSIVHRDIKLDNILLGFDTKLNKECIKIIDFGFARRVDIKEGEESALVSSRLGTAVYMAPEVFTFNNNEDYNAFKSDIFSLAIALFAILYNAFPDRETPSHEHPIVTVKEITFPEDTDIKVSQSAKQLILNMSCKDPVKRFNIIQILDSEWMQS